MNRIFSVAGGLCLAGLIALACGGSDGSSFVGSGGQAGSGGSAGSENGGAAGDDTSPGGSGDGASSAGGSGGGGTSAGGTGDGGTSAGGTSSVDGGDVTPEGGVPEAGAAPGEVFDTCASDDDCTGGLTCWRSGGTPTAQTPGYCSMPGCMSADAGGCPQPTTGDVESTCVPILDVCTLDCTLNNDCPDGMECQLVPPGALRCVYPPPTIEVYEECEPGGNCAEGSACHTALFYCAEPCSGVADCTEPTSGTAALACSQLSGRCVLDCSGDAECPTGMTCQQVGPSEYCGY